MTKQKDSAKKAIRDIRRVTRRQYSAEEKIRIVLEGLRGESSIAKERVKAAVRLWVVSSYSLLSGLNFRFYPQSSYSPSVNFSAVNGSKRPKAAV